MALEKYGHVEPGKVEVGQLATPPSQEEIDRGTKNYQVGTTLVFENERVRIWEILLQPGESLPFHCHRGSYYWIALEPGISFTVTPTGETWRWRHERNEVMFIESSDQPTIHNLKNDGASVLRFSTVELLA